MLRMRLALALLTVLSAVGHAQLVGVDFNTAASSAPQNWNSLTTAGTISNLMNDTGALTGWSFAVTTVAGGFTFATDANAATVPTHSYPLNDIDDYLTGNAGATGASQFRNLPPLTPFNVYAFGLRGFTPLSMDWTVSGDNTINFSQVDAAGVLWVNGEAGTSARSLSSYARVVTSSAGGTIDFIYDPTGSNPYAVAGLAIEIVPEPGSLGVLACVAVFALRRVRRQVNA